MPLVEGKLAKVIATLTRERWPRLPDLASAHEQGLTNFEAYIWSNSSGPDPLKYLTCFYSKTPQNACNYVKFSNADFDKLIDQAGNETDPAKQNDLLRQANNLLQEEAPLWFFNYNKAVMAYQPWVHGLKPNAMELAIQDYDGIWIDDSAPASRK